MTSIIKPCYDEKRSILAEKIPLETPFSIILTPSTACNFRCCYCAHSLSESDKKKGKFFPSKHGLVYFYEIEYLL